MRWLAAALVLLTCLASCRQSPESTETVEFWAMGREGEVVQRLMPEFERRHPGLGVHVQQIPWSAAHEKLLTAYVGGTMPDVFQAGTTWLPELAALGALEPLDNQVSGSNEINLDDYFAGVIDANTIDSSLVAVPWYVDTRLLFYRTDLVAAAGIEDAPRTWEAWRDVMARVQSRMGPGRHALLAPLREWELPVVLALQNGAQLLRDGDRYGNFASAPFAKAFHFYLSLFDSGLASRSAATEVGSLYQDFADGAFAFYVTGPWNLGEFARRLPASMKGRWGTAAMPAPDEERPGVSLAGGASLAIFRGSKKKEAAWRLIEYLSEPPQQLLLYGMSGDLPARISAWQDPTLRDAAAVAAFRLQLQRLRSTPKIPEWEQIASLISRYAEAAVRGDMDEGQALAALDRDVDRLLEKRRWLLQRTQPAGAIATPIGAAKRRTGVDGSAATPIGAAKRRTGANTGTDGP